MTLGPIELLSPVPLPCTSWTLDPFCHRRVLLWTFCVHGVIQNMGVCAPHLAKHYDFKVQPCHSMSVIHFFFLCNILLYGQAILLMLFDSHAGISPFWLLWMKLLWTFMCVCMSVFSFLLGMCVGEQLGHEIIPHWEFLERSSIPKPLCHSVLLPVGGQSPHSSYSHHGF